MAELILFFMEIKLWNVCQGVHHVSVTWAAALDRGQCPCRVRLHILLYFQPFSHLELAQRSFEEHFKQLNSSAPARGCIQVFCTRHERLCHVYLNKWAVISQLLLTSHWTIIHSTTWESAWKSSEIPKPSETGGRMVTDFRDINQARGVSGRVPALSLSLFEQHE